MGLLDNLIDINEVFKKTPLYKEIDLTLCGNEEGKIILHELLGTEETFDMYCVECKQNSVFFKDKTINSFSGSINGNRFIPDIYDGDYKIKALCTRDNNHKAIIFIRVKLPFVLKIGQYPSLADILKPDLKKYINILGEDRIKEWSKAIGLAAHGVGAGSYVYLRRIIESLIEDAHLVACKELDWNEEKYKSARYSEKIKMLSGFLPDFIIKNSNSYAILSKGIHEMKENDCLKYFEVLNSSIELIAEEKLAKKQIEDKKAATMRALSDISSSI